VTRLIEDLWLKDGMAISAAVMGGFTDLHTEGLHYLNGYFTITPTLLNMLKISPDQSGQGRTGEIIRTEVTRSG
jgi:hypothetical protein